MPKDRSLEELREWFRGAHYLDPKCNPAFLALLGKEDALISFLNATLRLEGSDRIESLRFQTEMPADFRIPDPFRVRFDIHARTRDNRYFDVEMQKIRGESYVDRMLLYNAVMLIRSKKDFDSDCGLGKAPRKDREAFRYTVPTVYSLWICDFSLDELREFKEYRDEWFVCSQNAISHGMAKPIGGKNKYIIYELEKFRKTKGELKTTEDKWLFVLANAGKDPELPEFSDDVFADALRRIEVHSADRELLSEQGRYLMDMDYVRTCAAQQVLRAEREAEAKAMVKAMAKAEAKVAAAEAKVAARAEVAAKAAAETAAINMARACLSLGKLTDREIAKCSGLSLRKVQMLKKS
jgi:hypothetical protein